MELGYSREWARGLLEESTVRELVLPEEWLYGLSPTTMKKLTRMISFLRAFSRRGIILDGCTAVNVSRNAVLSWRDEDWFEELYQAAALEACDSLEQEAHRRAVDGVDEPVIWQGMPTIVEDADTGDKRHLTVKKYSDNLLVTLMKGNMPEKYRENVKQTHAFEGQTGVLVVPAAVDAAAWAKVVQEQQAQYAGNVGEAKPT